MHQIINPYAKLRQENTGRPEHAGLLPAEIGRKNAPVVLGTLPTYFPKRQTLATTRNTTTTNPTDTASKTPPTTNDKENVAPPSTREDTNDTSTQQTIKNSNRIKPNDSVGDSFLVKHEHTNRLVYTNINSCQKTEKFTNCMQVCKDFKCDIIAFGETKANGKRKDLIEKFKAIARNKFEHVAITPSRNRATASGTFQAGGTLIASTGHWKGRAIQHIHDPRKLGRWSGQKFRLKNDRYMVVISAYRVCKQSSRSAGPDTALSQQHTLLREDGFTNPNPRKQFIDDMIEDIKKWKDKKTEIVLMLDANEAVGEEIDGIAKLLEKTQLVDAHERLHGELPPMNTHISGSKRIDYTFVSPGLIPFIVRGGYLPFYHGFSTDHRAMFIDFHNDIIDGITELHCTPVRSIGSRSPKTEIQKYKQYIDDQFDKHRVYAKATDLHLRADPTMSDNLPYLRDLNKLDATVTKIMLTAERKFCTKKPISDWSIELHQASQLIKYWIITLKGQRNNIDVTEQTTEVYDNLHQDYKRAIDTNQDSVVVNIRKARKAERTLQLQHKELRKKKRNDDISTEAEGSGNTIEQVKKKIEHAEESRRVFYALRLHFHPDARSGISYIEVPDLDKDGQPTDDPQAATSWKTITDPTEIENRLLDRNIEHFGQADGTPFTRGDLLAALGYEGISPGLDKILSGELPDNFEKLDPGSQAILKKLSDRQQLEQINDEITFEEFWQAIKKWNKQTTTSPSGRHLGHYKALLVKDGKEYDDDNPDPSDRIKGVIYRVAMCALLSRNTLERWTKVTTAMIEKIPGMPRIHKMRVIHLYEADYNLMLKILWARKLVWNTHNADKLNDGQAGSRPGRRSIDVVIQKEMKYMYARLTRTGLATMDNDAKSCYDRIICSLAMLVSSYFGMTDRSCQLQAKTLKRMQFRLRTALGESKRHYQHTDEKPVHGSGQGSCASPCLWLLISSILMDCLQELGTGMTMTNPTSAVLLKQWIDGFVDDTSLFANLPFAETDLKKLTDTLKMDTQIWDQLLSASGGKLEFSKCFYYILSWKFTSEGDPEPMTTAEIQAQTGPLTVPGDNNEPIEIKMLDVNDSHKTLGAHKTMIGDETKQLEELQTKSTRAATIAASSGLTRRQARTAYSRIYIPSMVYCLPATNLDEKSLTAVQKRAVHKFLPAMGYAHSFHRDIVYGPLQFGGLALEKLYTEECVAKIGSLIQHLRASTTLGQAMAINLDWTQLTAGTLTPILESDLPIRFMTDNWFLHLREFLITTGSTIYVKNAWKPILERKGDKTLMDAVLQLDMNPYKERYFKNWRLHFQVTTLADICNAAGKRVLKRYLERPKGKPSTSPRSTKLNWPYQEEPGPEGFRVWMHALKTCFGMTNDGKLQTPLGQWHTSPTKSHSKWQQYYDPESNKLFSRSQDGFQVFLPEMHRPNTSRYPADPASSIPFGDIPQTCIPVESEVTKNGSQTVVHGQCISQPTNTTVPPSNFTEYIAQLPEWESDLLRHIEISNLTSLKASLESATETLQIASDGGLREDTGSYGVAMGTSTEDLDTNRGRAHGNEELLSSYRAEAYGLLSAILLLRHFVKFYKINPTDGNTPRFFCDNLALAKILAKHFTNRMTVGEHYAPDVDLELQILAEIKQLKEVGIKFSLQHVKGHQDLTEEYDNLPRAAQMNVQADHGATRALQETQRSDKYIELPANRATLRIQGDVITSKYKEMLRRAHLSQDIRHRMMINFEWDKNTPDKIWWSVHGASLRILSHNDRIRVQKFIHDQLATNQRLAREKEHLEDRCTTCGYIGEDNDHILRCQTAQHNTTRQEWMIALSTYLRKDHTPPEVETAILGGLTAWLAKRPTPTIQSLVPNASTDLILAYKHQCQIGWRHFVRGRIAQEWAALIKYQIRSQRISSREMTPERWGVEVCNLSFNHFLRLWDIRNQVEHGVTPEEKDTKFRNKLLLEARFLQQHNPGISHVDRDWFFRPTSELENHSTHNIKVYLRNARSLANTNRIEQRNEIRPRTTRMTPATRNG